MTFDEKVSVAFCLVAFDGILDRANLGNALVGLQGRYRSSGHVLVDWYRSTDWLDRRRLSAWTLNALAAADDASERGRSVGEVLSELDQALKKKRDPRGLDGLFYDTHAWLLRVAPGPACSHVDGSNPMTPLPRTALSRLETKLALPLTSPVSPVDAAMGDAISSYLNASNASPRHDILDQLLAAARMKDQAKGLEKALSLGHQSRYAAPVTALVVAWAIDLMESGTRRLANVSQGTVQKYTRLVVMPLVQHFGSKRVEDLDEGSYFEGYKIIIDGTQQSEQGGAAAALTSWHEFLVEWLDVPLLRRSLHRDLPIRPAKANVIFGHERELITAWLDTPGEDWPRAHEQARVVWSLLRSSRIRIGELFHLLLSSINLYDQVMIVEVCGKKGAPLKTPSARRVIEIREPEAIKTILEWKTRRLQLDLALPDDFLFGDPHRPGAKCEIGTTYCYINRLLKAATGDCSVSTHTLSHTWACEEINASFSAARSEFAADINQLDAIASGAGHAGPSTTFINYYHWPEALVRTAIDRGIDEFVDWRHLQHDVRISHSAYRQRQSRSRRRTTGAAISAEGMVRASLPALPLPEASKGLALMPAADPLLLKAPKRLGFEEVLVILRDVFEGLNPSTIANRAGRSNEKVGLVQATLEKVLTRIDEPLMTFAPKAEEAPRIQFCRVDHPKLSFLRNFLRRQGSPSSLREAAQSWASCYCRGYVSLAAPPRAYALIKLLCNAEMPMNGAVVHVASLKGSPPSKTVYLAGNSATYLAKISKAEREARALFAAHSPVLPAFLQQSGRRGRPAIHFQLSAATSTKVSRRSGAGLSMAGFHALMLSCAVWAELDASTKN